VPLSRALLAFLFEGRKQTQPQCSVHERAHDRGGETLIQLQDAAFSDHVASDAQGRDPEQAPVDELPPDLDRVHGLHACGGHYARAAAYNEWKRRLKGSESLVQRKCLCVCHIHAEKAREVEDGRPQSKSTRSCTSTTASFTGSHIGPRRELLGSSIRTVQKIRIVEHGVCVSEH